jgi:aldehyde dehydrogenase (NAD+)
MEPAVPAVAHAAHDEHAARHAERHAELDAALSRQRAWFETGATLPEAYRRTALDRLLAALSKHEDRLLEALAQDLGKSRSEAYMTEVGLCRDEVRHALKRLSRWMRPRRVPTPLPQFAAASRVVPEPYGVALILAPWNYPVLLTIEPLASAVAAGNCAVVKPSNQTPATSQVLADLVADAFEPDHVRVVLGDRSANAHLIEQRYDYVFFTGSTEVGRQVMRAVSRHLTPVTLELGGKSPAVVDATAKIDLAARRIVFGKFINAGQTCVAPDYVLVHESRKDALLAALAREIARAYPGGVHDPNLPRIINEYHFDRLLGLMRDARVAVGGGHERKTLRIAPTVLDEVTPDSCAMAAEIFGPVLPVLAFRELDEAVRLIRARPKPLALYLFSEDRATKARFLRDVPFGGGCLNDTIIHLATPHMGFGGVGDSGMGSYHGKDGFDTFTHYKSVVDKKTWLDLPMRYMPHTPRTERILRLFLK